MMTIFLCYLFSDYKIGIIILGVVVMLEVIMVIILRQGNKDDSAKADSTDAFHAGAGNISGRSSLIKGKSEVFKAAKVTDDESSHSTKNTSRNFDNAFPDAQRVHRTTINQCLELPYFIMTSHQNKSVFSKASSRVIPLETVFFFSILKYFFNSPFFVPGHIS